jgi:hypothetical protein
MKIFVGPTCPQISSMFSPSPISRQKEVTLWIFQKSSLTSMRKEPTARWRWCAAL